MANNTYIPHDPVLGFRQGAGLGVDTSSNTTGGHGAQFTPGFRLALSHNFVAYYGLAATTLTANCTVTLNASGTLVSQDAGAYVMLASVELGGQYAWCRQKAVFASA